MSELEFSDPSSIISNVLNNAASYPAGSVCPVKSTEIRSRRVNNKRISFSSDVGSFIAGKGALAGGSNAQPPNSKSVTLSMELRGRAKNVESTSKWKYISGSQILPESYQQKCPTVRAKQHVSPTLLPASQLSFLYFEKAMNALPARLTLKITLCYTAKNPIQIEGKSDVIKRRRHNLCTTEKGVGLYIED